MQVFPIHFYGLVLPIHLDEAPFHLVQNVGGRPYEGPLHVLLVLGRGFHIQHVVVPGQFQSLVTMDHPFLGQIGFVSDEYQDNILVAVVLDVFDPATDTAESFLAGQVENHEGGCGGSVIRAGDGAEFLLTGSIPNLQFDYFVVDGDTFGPVLNPNGVLVVRIEIAVNKATDQTRFADAGVTDENELEGVVELILGQVKVIIVHRLVIL